MNPVPVPWCLTKKQFWILGSPKAQKCNKFSSTLCLKITNCIDSKLVPNAFFTCNKPIRTLVNTDLLLMMRMVLESNATA